MNDKSKGKFKGKTQQARVGVKPSRPELDKLKQLSLPDIFNTKSLSKKNIYPRDLNKDSGSN